MQQAWDQGVILLWGESLRKFLRPRGLIMYEQKTHKLIHELATPRQPLLDDPNINRDGTFNPFGDFAFTGLLRPVYPLSPKRIVPDHIQRPDYATDGRLLKLLRNAKTTIRRNTHRREQTGRPAPSNTERRGAREDAYRLSAREVLDIAASHVRPGVTTDYIDEIVHNAIIERNAYPSPLNYRGFPKSVCTSLNEVICHGIPDQRKLQEGDIINIGFHGDLNETYPVGRVDDDSKKLMRTARQCLDDAIKLCKPGALFRDLGKTMYAPPPSPSPFISDLLRWCRSEPIARSNGCATVRTYCGHGINDLFHCAPNVPHYAKNKAIGTMKPGMMINLGHNWDQVHWPDSWTATTIDGKRSAQFEETLLITETGVEVMTAGKKRADLA
ncbi:Methionine aminopeptidase 1 [Grifola frondosa]|uniref:Methionine aminopeptidase 1 n=1 Tax=Grifola frondosa TaxID=5627 RepID=A0A1C7MF22_GRIFR|nr:Methionine aminopeptidase 1 [Grifola frondosa]